LVSDREHDLERIREALPQGTVVRVIRPTELGPLLQRRAIWGAVVDERSLNPALAAELAALQKKRRASSCCRRGSLA
jgi:hypothetical protein